ncbi:hypothetical protein [Psychroserpens algicola]|uniref:Uncharacterized protein n=1 Tax=Psychroserpens algicola TaxID=1719034 RepID=A0ABT0H5L1_9FLAO|nr:hypothetical protein [Psychroserpens algicola]MCK8479668.1 hypothetical protein [Psychroserpens algicola]
MNENVDKYLDGLSRKVIGKSSVESPSFDFTQRVMSKIESLNTSVTTYRPLISKPVWAVILLGVIAVFGYVIFGKLTLNYEWIQDLSLDKVSFNPLPDFSLSQTMTYAILLFAVMLCVQVPLLKRYFDKRLDA